MTHSWSSKEYLYNFYELKSQIIINETPEFYLLYLVRNYLLNHKFNLHDSNIIISIINIDFPEWLGSSYKPHEEFLTALSVKIAITIINIYSAYEKEFGKEAAFNILKNISVALKK